MRQTGKELDALQVVDNFIVPSFEGNRLHILYLHGAEPAVAVGIEVVADVLAEELVGEVHGVNFDRAEDGERRTVGAYHLPVAFVGREELRLRGLIVAIVAVGVGELGFLSVAGAVGQFAEEHAGGVIVQLVAVAAQFGEAGACDVEYLQAAVLAL